MIYSLSIAVRVFVSRVSISFFVLHVNAHKTEYMCYNQTGDISTIDGTSLKLLDKFTYLGKKSYTSYLISILRFQIWIHKQTSIILNW